MRQIILFAVLGLGVGAIYTLMAQGIVVIYRGSGVLNFAQGAFAMFGAYCYAELRGAGWPFAPAFLIAVAATAMLGLLTHYVIMRRLRNASGLMRLVATLGLLVVLEGIAVLLYGANSTLVQPSLPQSPWRVWGVSVAQDQYWLFLIAAGLTAGLWALGRFTVFGLATSAAAENERSAAALGWSVDLLAGVTWGVGSALAAVAGILVAPLTGLSATDLTLLIIPALATGLLGGFTSLPLTLACGMLIGILQSEMARYVSTPGLSDSLPFFIILLVLVVRGRSLPLRGHVLDRLPGLGSGMLRPRVIVPIAVLIVLGMLTIFPPSLTTALTIQASVGLLLLSFVVVTGYAGQLSLGQLAISGVGAYIAGRLVASAHWPFEVALLAGAIGAGLTGFAFGLPALRTRGVNLAVLTLGLGFALQQLVFNNSNLTGGVLGLTIGPSHVLGIDIDPILYPNRYGVFCVVCFTLASLGVANLRRSRAGRRMISIRTNERAAASLGVSVFGAKLSAFTLGSAIAGLAGVIVAFNGYSLVFNTGYDPISSVTYLGDTVIGGLGYVTGPILGSSFVPGGIASVILNHFGSIDDWLAVAGGLVLILVICQNPDGIVGEIAKGRDPVGRLARTVAGRWRARSAGLDVSRAPVSAAAAAGAEATPVHAPARADATATVPSANVMLTSSPRASDVHSSRRLRGTRSDVGARLEVSQLTVLFGAVAAVSDLDLTVTSGEVLGLIGPNGAGKTTVIDSIAGYVRPSRGRITMNGLPLGQLPAYRRVRLGVTRSFQSLELFEDLTVLENLLAASDKRDKGAYLTNLFRPGKPTLEGATLSAVTEFGLADVLHRKPTELPYGVRRLVAIARAVATGPSILLLDEPAAGLGMTERSELGALVRRLADDWNLGILLVEHDIELVMAISDRVVAIDFGRKIAEGPPGDVARAAQVVAAYLGVATK